MSTLSVSPSVIEKIKSQCITFQSLPLEISKVIVGQNEIINTITLALLCDGHILFEGVPGVAKTTMVKSIANALGLKFNRIQFTPDLLPADVIGTLIYNPKNHEFETKKGPIFTQLLLADEINRAPAKVQAALLEAMQERQVTIGSQTYVLEKPFLVFATQNPVEQEGTYRLPEAQVDRFMFKVLVHYPTKTEERELMRRILDPRVINQVLSAQDILDARELVSQVFVSDAIQEYIVNIVFATRMPEAFKLHDIKPFIQYGVSPRATLALFNAAKAQAFLRQRHFVTPDDVKMVCVSILRHRVMLTYQAEAEQLTTDQIIQKILAAVPCP